MTTKLIYAKKIMEERYQTFTSLILNISRCIHKIKNSEVAELGMKGKHVQCLFFLYKYSEGASLTQLCEFCDEDKGAMSRTVKELIHKGMVYVDETSSQKYRNPIKLTLQGKANAGIVSEKIAHMVASGGKGLTEKEREVFYRSLIQISKNLTAVCENYGGQND